MRRRVGKAGPRGLCATVLTLLVLPAAASGQDVIQMGAGGVGSFPTGSFHHLMGEAGVGAAVDITVPIGEGWAAGAVLAWQIYATHKGLVPAPSMLPGGGDWEAELHTSHHIAAGHLFLRRRRSGGTLRPYGELLLGFVHPFTRAERTAIRTIDSDPAGSAETIGDTALSAGVGTGVQIHLRSRREPEGEDGHEHGWGAAQIELRLRWITSRPARYVRKDTLGWDGDEFVYTWDRSPVSFFQPYIGITFGF